MHLARVRVRNVALENIRTKKRKPSAFNARPVLLTYVVLSYCLSVFVLFVSLVDGGGCCFLVDAIELCVI